MTSYMETNNSSEEQPTLSSKQEWPSSEWKEEEEVLRYERTRKKEIWSSGNCVANIWRIQK
jgi:hypothetical protein